MGGVPTLLLVIAAGITYGWQPDREGGVEYIIQIPPDQIQRLERTGEITSVIDPAVRGHVSRVIIKVGNGPLPQDLPSNLRGRTASGTAASTTYEVADSAPIPIPEMGDSKIAEPIPGELALSAAGAQAVLKPDTNSPSGATGYGFPPPPSTLQTAPPTVDQAGRTVPGATTGQTGTAYGSATPPPSTYGAAPAADGTMRVPPPATRTSPPSSYGQSTPPPFTGSTPQNYAGARTGGPSTDPTGTRDSTWKNFPAPPTTASSGTTTSSAASAMGMSAPPPENPFQKSAAGNTARSSSPGTYSTPPPSTYSASPTSSSTAGGTSGLAPGDTYGQVPSGLGFSSSNPAAATTGSNAGGFFGSTSAGSAASRSATSTAAPRYGAPPASTTSGASLYGANASATPTASSGRSNSAKPDPLLHPSQVQAGAWSIDNYGRIYDRQGNLMTSTASGLRSVASSSAPNTAGQPRSTSGPTMYGSPPVGRGGAPAPSTTGGNFTQHNAAQPNSRLGIPTTGGTAASGGGFTAAASAPGGPTHGYAPSGQGRVHQASNPTTANAGSRSGPVLATSDPPSLSDSGHAAAGNSHSGSAKREVVSTKPLFNGLLLVSIVANIYLIFWLKNLRIQFREMVAAKRLASSSGQ